MDVKYAKIYDIRGILWMFWIGLCSPVHTDGAQAENGCRAEEHVQGDPNVAEHPAQLPRACNQDSKLKTFRQPFAARSGATNLKFRSKVNLISNIFHGFQQMPHLRPIKAASSANFGNVSGPLQPVSGLILYRKSTDFSIWPQHFELLQCFLLVGGLSSD